MGDITEATWTTEIRGETVELPATISGIRAALATDADRQAFDGEVERTPRQDLHRVLGRWALVPHPEATEEDDEIVARLRAGDFSGCTVIGSVDEGAA